MIEIPVGHEYTVLALPVTRLTLSVSDPLALGDDSYALGQPPVPLPDHWKTGLGTLRIDEVSRANLFLLAHRASRAPEAIDHENRALAGTVHRLYFGLLIASPYLGHRMGLLISGTRSEGELDVREVQEYDSVVPPPGCVGTQLGDPVLHYSHRLAAGIHVIQGTNEHSRIWRILDAFYAAVKSNQLGVRIHQFVRCVEGFVLPETGRTRRQMISRARLFVGPRNDSLIGTLFDIRSSVEHLHGPYHVVAGHDVKEKMLVLAELAHKSEVIARHCLQRLFGQPDVWPHFNDDASLGRFWSCDPGQRIRLWGPPLDAASAFSDFNRTAAASELGS